MLFSHSSRCTFSILLDGLRNAGIICQHTRELMVCELATLEVCHYYGVDCSCLVHMRNLLIAKKYWTHGPLA